MSRLLPVLALALLAGCAKAPASAAKPASRTYRVTTIVAEARPLSYVVSATGSIEPHEMVTIPARVEGSIEKLAFEEGKEVTPDDVLAVIDGQKYALEKEQADRAVTRAEAAARQSTAQLAGARAMLEEAEANLERRRGLRAQNASWVSDEEMANQEATVKRTRAAFGQWEAGEAEAKAAVQVAESALALAKKRLADSEVHSPIAGVVEMKHVSAAQYLKVGEKIATLVDARNLRVRFRVNEGESVRITAKSEITFAVAPFPKHLFHATLAHIHATADPASRMVEVLADVTDPQPGLKPGFFASVTVRVGGSDKAVVIPEEAILPTEKGFVVFLVDGAKARLVPVQLGLHTEEGGIEILSGVDAGQTIVLEGARMLSDGVSIEVVAPAATKN